MEYGKHKKIKQTTKKIDWNGNTIYISSFIHVKLFL